MNILIISDHGHDDEEMLYPYYRLLEEGCEVTVAARSKEQLHAKYHFTIQVDKTFEEIRVEDYDGLVLPGGHAPETVRRIPKAVQIVRDFMEAGKPVASICHGQQILISAKVLQGMKATCYCGITDDLINAGAVYLNEPVVVCRNLVTSREPVDLPYFMREFLKLLKG